MLKARVVRTCLMTFLVGVFLLGGLTEASAGRRVTVNSPLTQLLANGFTADQVVSLLEDAGLSGLKKNQFYKDPMIGLAGLETFTDDQVRLLQASIAVDLFLLRLDNYAWGPGDAGDTAYLAESVQMVKKCLSQARYQEVYNQLNHTLADFASPLTIDHVISATNNLLETVTLWARNGEIANPVTECDSLMDALAELTLHYYVLENRGEAAIEEAITYDILPDISGTQYPQADLGGLVTIYNADGSVATSDVEPLPVPEPTPAPEPTPEPEPVTYPAVVLESVAVDGDSFVLTWSLPNTISEVPSGDYDIIIDGTDTGSEWRTDQTTTVITGLEAGVTHTFRIQARWLQADPDQVPLSNELTGMIPVEAPPVIEPGVYPAPVLESVEVDGGNFVLNWSLPSNLYGDPSGGYDIVIDGVDTATQWRTDQTSVVISGLEVGVNHCFKIEARWLQADPYLFPRSNELCGMIPADAGTVPDPDPVEDPVSDPDPVDPPSTPADGSLKVFPGAEGYGVDTPAGRGGRIIHVTNLNDSGTGSFRAAVEASGPRIVVFDVSGTIELQKDIKISNPYITIAGQTAPAPGIQLKNQTVQVSTHDVLMQHLALRPGDTFVSGSGGEVHALIVTSSAYNCVFDHLSLYWGIDECVGVYGDNLTFSNNIIAEGLDDSLHPDGAHSCGMLIMAGADNVAVVRNLYANHNSRSPWIKENTTVYHANNYAYNSRGTFFNFTTDRDPYTGSLISVSNVYGKGPSSDTYKGLSVSSNYTSADVYEADSRGDSESPYGVLSTLVKCASEYRVDYHPFDAPAYSRMDSGSVKNHIIANAGSRPAMRDSADARVINQLMTFSGSLIDSPSQVGGWPHYAATQRVFNEGSNPHGDDDGDGYTNIEEILHQMSADVEG